jgi:L,D-transpeptidase catalytic domain
MSSMLSVWSMILLLSASISAGVPEETGNDAGYLPYEVREESFNQSISELYYEMCLDEYGLSFNAFYYGMVGYYSYSLDQPIENQEILTIIDFSKSSNENRFFTIDMKNKKCLFHTYVAHGMNSGEEIPYQFSNRPNSHQSSLGFYVTGNTYIGQNGYSMILNGMEYGINNNARKRSIVVHGADYVSKKYIRQNGRLGRSWGCPALSFEDYKPVINTIKDGSLLYIYSDKAEYLSQTNKTNLRKAVYSFYQNKG